MNRVRVVCTAAGIGDACQMLLACAGLQRDGHHVTYIVGERQAPWVRLFGGYDVLETIPDPESYVPPTPLAVHFGHAESPEPGVFYPGLTYGQQNRERLARPRWEHYARACGTEAVLPAVNEPDIRHLQWSRKFAGAIAAAPSCSPLAGPSRRWLLSHWMHLLHQIPDVVVIDSDDASYRVLPGRGVLGQTPPVVAALLRSSRCLISADTGIAHVAGLLGVPAIVLCSQVRGQQVYGCYPSARVIQGPLGCTGCHWQPDTEYRPHCRTLCADLQSITPDRVMEEIARLGSR